MFVQTLPSHARSLLRQLGRLPRVASFYLAGGSAVALHLGHRVSVDLDFFTLRDDYAMEPLIQDLQSVAQLVKGELSLVPDHPLTGLLRRRRVGPDAYDVDHARVD
jgi:hypothetical protein